MRSPTPHDALFKYVFGRPKHARSFLRDVLPEGLSSQVDWPSLKRRPGSFVNEDLREKHTDLLFTARLAGGSACFFYFLFEHQSTADPWMLLRLLEYMVRIWRDYLAKHPKATLLPLIVPVVLHHSETGWTCATAFEELIDLGDQAASGSRPSAAAAASGLRPPAAAAASGSRPSAAAARETSTGTAAARRRLRTDALQYVPRFRIELNDVSHLTDEELRQRAVSALVKLVLACFRHARDMRSLLENLSAWSATLAEVRAAPDGMRALAHVLRYMFQAASDMDPDEVRGLARKMADPVVAEEIVSLAKKLRDQGRQEGRQEGRAETVLKQLGLKFRKVPASVIARVKAGSEAELDRWTARILVANSLAEVLDG